MPALRPLQSYLFDINALCPDYRQFLDGEDGWATVQFDNSTAFARLLILWQANEGGELQVTLGNFDCAEHETSLCASEKPAYMKHWAIVSSRLQSTIYLMVYREIYEPGSEDIEPVVSMQKSESFTPQHSF